MHTAYGGEIEKAINFSVACYEKYCIHKERIQTYTYGRTHTSCRNYNYYIRRLLIDCFMWPVPWGVKLRHSCYM